MDKDAKILLMAIVIILVALVSFNLSDLTGKVASDVTTITVSTGEPNDLVTFGLHDTAKMITIRVLPSESGIAQKIQMYRVKPGGYDLALSTETADLCRGSTCDKDVTISYRLSSGLLDGEYYFKAENRNGEEVATSNTFEIVH